MNFFHNPKLREINQRLKTLQGIELLCKPKEKNTSKISRGIFLMNEDEIGSIDFEIVAPEGVACARKSICITIELFIGGTL